MSHIAIIGTGRMAAGLGAGWARAGHAVVYGSRDPARSAASAALGGARVATHTGALEGAEVVVITLPYPAVERFAADHAAALRGKLVVDITNPFHHLPDNRISGAEVTAAAIGPGARVVAAFKANFAETLLEPIGENGMVRDVLYAGDDEAGKRIVAALIEDLGFRPVDCGALRNARVLDGMVPLIIELDARSGGGHKSSWKFLA